jgi:hypothetical protein
MRTLLLSLLLSVSLFGQTFPSGIYTPLQAANNVQTTLTSAAAAGDLTLVVASTTGWAANMLAYVCDTTTVTSSVARCSGTFEVMLVTAVPSSVLLTVTRAQDGTSAIAHAAGKGVLNAPVSKYINSAQIELAAIETALGTNLSNIPTSPIVGSATYNFAAQSPTSPASLTAGSRTITMPGGCPLGVTGTNSKHYLYVAGTGTGEAALITGGTCVSGATTGTVTLTIANSHSAGYTVSSATAGIQEAIMVLAAATSGGRVFTPGGSLNIYGPISPPYQYTYWIEGTGRSSTQLNVATTFCNPAALACTLATNGVFDFSPSQVTATAADSGGVRNLTIGFTQPNSTNVALYTAWPPAVYASGNNHVTVENVIIERAWDSITSPLSNGITVHNVGSSHFHRGLTVDVAFDVVDVTNFEAWVFGLETNQSTAFRAVGTANYSLDIGGVDLLNISGFTSIAGKCAKLYKSGAAVPHVNAVNFDCDTNGGFEMSNGYVKISNFTTSTLVNTAAISVSGGTLVINGLDIINNGSVTSNVTYNPSAANAGYAAAFLPGIFITNAQFAGSGEDQQIVYATTSGAFAGVGTVQIHGGTVGRTPGVAYALPLFQEVAGTGSVIMDIQDVTVVTNAGTAAVAFNFGSANRHTVMNTKTSAASGWSYTVPVATTVWFNNPGFTSSVSTLLDPLQLTGHLTFSADNTYDVGATGATRPRNGFFGTSLTVGATGGYIWASSSQILSPSDGIIRLSNNAGTAFTRLQFGGTTASFPSIKRNSAALNFRLADDSGDAAITAAAISGTVLTSTVTTGTAPIVAASTTPVANLTGQVLAYNPAGTQQTSAHTVFWTCTLGTSCVITLSGSAAFTSASSYYCSGTDQTAAAAVKIVNSAAGTITVTGTGTDVISGVCIGN